MSDMIPYAESGAHAIRVVGVVPVGVAVAVDIVEIVGVARIRRTEPPPVRGSQQRYCDVTQSLYIKFLYLSLSAFLTPAMSFASSSMSRAHSVKA